MIDDGFAPDFPAQVAAELRAIDETQIIKNANAKDLRALLWSSIDNDDSRDLDQIEVAERLDDDQIRLLIGIADVAAFVPVGSAIDRHAAQNTTSVYTGIETFSLLPKELSENITSLLDDAERLAIVIDLVVAANGGVKLNDIYPAVVKNRAKLVYDSAGAWLENTGELPEKAARVAGMDEQLKLQDEAARRLRTVRMQAGALEFDTAEAATQKRGQDNYEIVVKHKNAAGYLIENLMITANVLMAQFLEAKNFPTIERVVRRPERWPRIVELAKNYNENLPDEPDSRALSEFLERRRAADPIHFQDLSLAVVKLIGAGDYTVIKPGEKSAGHFGLAVNGYTHSTAPNRRYADIITQRMVKAAIANQAATYSIEELEQIAETCNDRQSAARKVERLTRKIVAAQALTSRIGQTFNAIITGVSSKGTFARLLNPPAEGRIVENETGLDVGDRVTVRLISTEPEKGFIDFERI